MDSPARRIVLRMHSNMFERYVEITNSWFQRCNYCDLEDVAHDVYDWSDRHFVHVGGENADRWHLIVDMEKDQLSSLDPQQIPYEVYRVTSNQDGELYFNFLDPTKFSSFYTEVRRYGASFAWGRPNRMFREEVDQRE